MMRNDIDGILDALTKRGGKTFYLYTHSYPDGNIFYVGKGVGDRAKDFFNRNRWHKGVCKKIGIKNVIIKAYQTVDERHALAAENQLILALKRAGITLCNLSNGGEVGSGGRFSEEHRRKLSEAGKGFKKSPETLEKMRIARIGRKLSLAHKQKLKQRPLEKQIQAMRLANLGKKRDPETVLKVAFANKGQLRSPEAKENMRLAHIGIKHDPSTREKRSIALKAAWARRKLGAGAI